MPFDGTELELPEDHPLSRLGAVERLLATEEQWCRAHCATVMAVIALWAPCKR